MNINLMLKFKKEFLWWFEDPKKRSCLVKQGEVWRLSHKPFEGYDKPFEGMMPIEVEAIVPNDEYAKFRMAYEDGEVIQFRDSLNNWTDSKQKPSFNIGVTRYRIKPSWKWQDEISEDKPVIVRNEGNELIAVERVDERNVAYADGGNYRCSVTSCKLQPITVADLHPFQRKGYYSIEELDKAWSMLEEQFSHRWMFDDLIKRLKEKEAKQ